MRRILVLAAVALFVGLLIFAAEDVRAPLGWASFGYLLLRAAPGIGRDWGRLTGSGYVGRRRFPRFPRIKGDTL